MNTNISKDVFLNMNLKLFDKGGYYFAHHGFLEELRGQCETMKVKEILDLCVPIIENKDEILSKPIENQYLKCLILGFRRYIAQNCHDWRGGWPPDNNLGEEMTDQEITLFLERKPLIIRGGVLADGYHRCFCSIGRLIYGKPYIPLYA